MRIWLVFIIGGIGTYLTRASFFALGPTVELPSWSRRALKYVAPAVFAAIVLPPILGDGGLTGVVAPDARLVAAAVAAAVAYKTKNITSVLIVGMLTLWTVQWLGL